MQGLDVEKYRPYVDGFDLSQEQQDELLKAMWSMLETFVDRSFEEDPVQHLLGTASDSDGKSRNDEVDSDEKWIDKREPRQ
ncbi:hypothetical protein [Chromatocurvus halotolerans]|uniref:hypothetical protein n=1 Tax=Chromatocurvus halotolerans TaxID=1132028 RepID=UPI000E3CDEB2|nr:hypothetical protein [Chromatocurvus halotolerans]